MPYKFSNPGSFVDSQKRNGLVLHPERQRQLYEREAQLFRATHPDNVSDDRLGPTERVYRAQYDIAIKAGELVVETSDFRLPVTPILTTQERLVLAHYAQSS